MPLKPFQSAWNVINQLKPELFGQNILLTILLGVAVSSWILRYTDWGEAVFGVLALTGIFTWLAMVLKLLKPSRIENLQNQLENATFANSHFRCVMVWVVGITALLGLFLGTVEVKAVRETTDRTVRVYRHTFPKEADETVLPGAHVRFVLLTFPGIPSIVHVKVGGYPDKSVRLKPFGRKTLQTATSFYREVVLLRPEPELIEIGTAKLRIAVSKSGSSETTSAEFDGRSVWVNTDSDVEVPLAVVDSWRAEAAGLGRPGLLNNWVRPEAFATPLVLQKDDKLEICTLQRKENGRIRECCAQNPISVREYRSTEDFPQVVSIPIYKDCHEKP